MYPEPFKSGIATITPPASLRVMDPGVVAPYNLISSISLERTFKNTSVSQRPLRIPPRRSSIPQPGPQCAAARRIDQAGSGSRQRAEPGIDGVFTFAGPDAERPRQRFSIFNSTFPTATTRDTTTATVPFGTPSDNYDLGVRLGPLEHSGASTRQPLNAKLFMGVFLTGTVSRKQRESLQRHDRQRRKP